MAALALRISWGRERRLTALRRRTVDTFKFHLKVFSIVDLEKPTEPNEKLSLKHTCLYEPANSPL